MILGTPIDYEIKDIYDRIFFSDTHLSTLVCNDNDLLDFLDNFYAPKVYILGDLIDLWKLKTLDYWPDNHSEILEGIIQKLYDKCEVRYIIGNHDEFFKNFEGAFRNLTLAKQEFIEIGDKKLLMIHGHQFDLIVKLFKPLAILATGPYDWLSYIGESINKLKIKFGFEPFSLSKYLKKKSRKIANYEGILLKYVRQMGMDGVICGHTHIPELTIKQNLIYANTGDFVSNSSFIVQDGNELILMKYENKKVKAIKNLKM